MLVASESSLFITIAITFAIVAHPKTYRLVHDLAKKIGGPNIINAYGVTTTGLLAHAVVAALLATMIIQYLM